MSDVLSNLYLNNYHQDNYAKFAPFSGYSMPINYNLGIIKEHLHVRDAVGIFDVSHMGQILVTLSNANIYILRKYIPLNFDNLITNKSYYTFMLNIYGGVIDDIIVSKILYENTEYFFIVYNAGRKKVDEEIFKKNLTEYFFLRNNSLLAIQGPLAEEVVNFLKISNQLSFMNSKVIKYLDNLIIINRSGYTGEDGFEFSIPNIIVLQFLKEVMNNSNSMLCGLGARDSLRLEAGLCLYGNELTETITPIEANLTRFIHPERLHDKNLNGQKILLSQLKEGTNKTKVGLKSLSKSILRTNMKLIDNKRNEIGVITSGGFSPTLNTSIAIGYLNFTLKNNAEIFTLIRGNVEKLEIVKLPFVSHKYMRG